MQKPEARSRFRLLRVIGQWTMRGLREALLQGGVGNEEDRLHRRYDNVLAPIRQVRLL